MTRTGQDELGTMTGMCAQGGMWARKGREIRKVGQKRQEQDPFVQDKGQNTTRITTRMVTESTRTTQIP